MKECIQLFHSHDYDAIYNRITPINLIFSELSVEDTCPSRNTLLPEKDKKIRGALKTPSSDSSIIGILSSRDEFVRGSRFIFNKEAMNTLIRKKVVEKLREYGVDIGQLG